MSESAAQAPSMIVGNDGFVVGWHGPLGPCVARFDTAAREVPIYARTLGRPAVDLPVTPCLWLSGGRLVALWCEEEGAFAAALSEDGSASAPSCLHEGARAIAIAPGSERATVFCADDRGIVRLELDGAARLASPARRCVSERRAGIVLSAARVRDESILAFVHRGGSSLGVVTTRGDDETVVRHAMRGECEDVSLGAAGGRAAVVIEHAGDRVLAGVLGPDGKLIERPRPRLERTLSRPGSPRVVWTEDAWTLLAHDRKSDRLVVHPLGERGEELTLPRCDGPFTAAYWAQSFYVLEAAPDDDGAELRLWRFARDGSGPQQRVMRLAVRDAASRRTALASRRVLASLCEAMVPAHGYRDAAARPALSSDGASLTILDADGRLTVGISPLPDRVRLHVASTLGEPSLSGDARLSDAPSSLVRLASWVRHRFSAAERERAAADRTWGEALAAELDAVLVRIDRAGAALVLELTVAEVPLAARLDRWLRRVRDEHAQRGL